MEGIQTSAARASLGCKAGAFLIPLACWWGLMDVITLLRVGVPGETSHGLQWWSLPREQGQRRFLIVDLSRAVGRTGK